MDPSLTNPMRLGSTWAVRMQRVMVGLFFLAYLLMVFEFQGNLSQWVAVALLGAGYLVSALGGFAWASAGGQTRALLYLGGHVLFTGVLMSLGALGIGSTLLLLLVLSQATRLLPLRWLLITCAALPLLHLGMNWADFLRQGLGLALAGVFVVFVTQLALNEQRLRAEKEHLATELAAANQRLQGYALQAEEALQETRQHFDMALQVTADAVYDWNILSGKTRWNHGLQTLFGYLGEGEEPHDWWAGQVHPDDHARTMTSVGTAIQNGDKYWSDEYRFKRADGSYAHVIDRGYFIYNDSGQATRMVGAMIDITDRVRLAQAQAEAALEERQRLARDLHDSVTQSLYSLTLLAEASRRLAKTGDLASVEGHLARLGETAQQSLKEMRLLVYQLRPPVLESEGLVGALQHRLDAVEKRAGIQARLRTQGTIQLSPAVEEGLFRIAQEALNNALKHAGAITITVKLEASSDGVELEISDNGKGFDPARADWGGMGLGSMRERAEKIGGSLVLDSEPGRGTTVRVRIGRAV